MMEVIETLRYGYDIKWCLAFLLVYEAEDLIMLLCII